ncbi:MAG: 3-hydroxybutyryl-CoA dehydrogenase [Sediminibacterium sp.]|nr:3-hydroxybutyryl-CoA dehydrogenase [Sediminibacterium sp.]MBX9780589.1 3-hydroxybutyryl-CoA dehydrogenase [Chitinophagaceae bacterium]
MAEIQTILVCGAGTMGSGIAQLSAVSGYRTILFDLDSAILTRAEQQISTQLQKLEEKGVISKETNKAASERIQFTTDLNLCKADLAIEAIIENVTIKKDLFHKLAELNGKETIYASNTSSISINSLVEGFMYPAQFAGMHFFNPAPVMKLVEIIQGAQTDPNIIAVLVGVAKQMKKIPVRCSDAPGFIVNRVARHFYLEAMYMVENRHLNIEQADAIMEAAGFKMGPFKLMDLIGLDINYSVSNIVWEALQKPKRLTPSSLQKEKVDAGDLGKKTRKGFYNYL